jgi:PAS domain-containing protein
MLWNMKKFFKVHPSAPCALPLLLFFLQGLVQHVNDPFLRLFGYRKGELEGCNVSRIMPNPFSAQHDSEWGGEQASWCWGCSTGHSLSGQG